MNSKICEELSSGKKIIKYGFLIQFFESFHINIIQIFSSFLPMDLRKYMKQNEQDFLPGLLHMQREMREVNTVRKDE